MLIASKYILDLIYKYFFNASFLHIHSFSLAHSKVQKNFVYLIIHLNE